MYRCYITAFHDFRYAFWILLCDSRNLPTTSRLDRLNKFSGLIAKPLSIAGLPPPYSGCGWQLLKRPYKLRFLVDVLACLYVVPITITLVAPLLFIILTIQMLEDAQIYSKANSSF